MPVDPDEYSQNAGSSAWVAAVAKDRFPGEFVGELLVAMRIVAGDHDMFEVRHPAEHVLHHRQQRFRNEQHPRAAIRQHVGILIRRQQRVERHRHDAGADRAQKHDRKIDGVEHDHRDALFAADAETAQHVGEAAALLLQLAIGQLGNGIGEGEFVPAPLIDVAVEQPGHGIVGRTSLMPRSRSHACTTLLPRF